MLESICYKRSTKKNFKYLLQNPLQAIIMNIIQELSKGVPFDIGRCAEKQKEGEYDDSNVAVRCTVAESEL